MLFDSHAHLNDKKLYDDLEGVLARAEDAGVKRILNCGADWPSSLMSLRLAEKYPGQIYAAVGVHPHDAKTLTDEMLQKLLKLAEAPEVVAWGEIGLDYYRDLSPRTVQQSAFIAQIAAAKSAKKPIIIHDREAHGDIMRIVRQERAGENGGVFHCFSGGWEMAKECLNLGFMISFAGPLTYTNAPKLGEVAAKVPPDMMLTETDSPYLSPHPYRGKINEPARVSLVAARLAEIRSQSPEEISGITAKNACRLFGINQ
ncbi:MAG: TatD family hydrolase [Clostridiales bacterium]|nr:TatD family hydrolase [Clostridiales bacterium]